MISYIKTYNISYWVLYLADDTVFSTLTIYVGNHDVLNKDRCSLTH